MTHPIRTEFPIVRLDGHEVRFGYMDISHPAFVVHGEAAFVPLLACSIEAWEILTKRTAGEIAQQRCNLSMEGAQI